MANYSLLDADEQDDLVVEFMRAQQRDHHSHTINLARYNTMLAGALPPAFRQRIEELRAETLERLAEVGAIMSATELPPDARRTAALARIKTREAAREAAPVVR